MKYCAMANTATLATGFIGYGQILTTKQVAALGQEKIRELVTGGLLKEMPEGEPEAQKPENKPEPETKAMPDAPAEQEANDLPELALDEGLIDDGTTGKAAKKGGRRKSK